MTSSSVSTVLMADQQELPNNPMDNLVLNEDQRRILFNVLEKEETFRKRTRPDGDQKDESISKRGRGNLNKKQEDLYKVARNAQAKAAQNEVDNQHYRKYQSMEGHFIPGNLQVRHKTFS